MVTWLIGLSASGKTTISQLVATELRCNGHPVVLLDGDIIRELFGNDVDHSIEGRRRNAARISKLTKFLSDQNICVVAAVLSIFPEWQRWNRENIKNYYEVFLDVEIETLLRRENKELYSRALAGKIDNVVGIDIPFPKPVNADLIIDNNQDRDDFSYIVAEIMQLIK